jgi:hypothetical protein
MRRLCFINSTLWFSGAWIAVVTAMAGEPVSFRQQIRPILSANCFKCHGPDPQSREADLRLDRFEDATAKHDDHCAIVPSKPESSELYRRIIATDDSERMPPPSSNKHLTDEQKELLRRWIAEGAKYEPHWAFVAPQRTELPTITDSTWPKNGIDYFVLAELRRNGLSPSAPADKYQLIRRLYLDLLGLPPTPAEADAFAADKRPGAYARLVDRLLDSPHYGERWARRWLDLARYSDTNGYEKDRPRTMWPYRDWVIKALNDDMPFTEFTIEQLAGDMLPGATQSQRIATGFHRNTMVNEEGGVDPQEFRFNSIVDRVGTTGTAWLGLTLRCAQCHTHKFDPITHQDFYRIFAFFNNANEVDEHLITPEIAEKRAAIQKQIDDLVAALPDQYPVPDASSQAPPSAERRRAMKSAFERWQDETKREVAHWKSFAPVTARAGMATITVRDDKSVLVSGDVTKKDIYDLEFEVGARTIRALRIEALLDDSLPKGGPGRQTIEVPNASSEGDFFLSEMTCEVVQPERERQRVVDKLRFSSAIATYTTPGLSPASAFDGRSDTGWRVMGRVGEPHAAVFYLATPVKIEAGQRLHLKLEHESFYPAGVGRFRISLSEDAGELPIALYPDDVMKALLKPTSARKSPDTKLLLDYFLLHTPALKDAQEKIAERRKQMPAALNALVMQERVIEPRITHRHHRGEFLKPEEPVEPGVPEILPQLPKGVVPNRLAFARWLVDPKNPLVARVFVNRQWQAFFGRGIVRTLEDFGVQGEYPTHPKLLDYLALEFINRGWSMKRLHRLIVTSATYQQSDAVTPQHFERDPENKLLARAPRLRVEAELVRDIMLKTSGLLCERVGGPSVFPDQPAGITEVAYGPLQWKVSSGEDRFRRGIYTFNKRTAPYAMFGLFDAPSGEACVARRTYSNTPLQALAILNDSVTIAAARALAISAIRLDPHNKRAIADNILRRCVSRPSQTNEIEWLCDFQKTAASNLATGKRDANILPSGDSDVTLPAELDKTDVAAWVLTARAVLNLNETITRP